MTKKYAPLDPVLFEKARKLPLAVRESMVQRILQKIHEDNKQVLQKTF